MLSLGRAYGWALALPPLALFLVFFVLPLFYLFYISLHAPSQTEFYGDGPTLRNYYSVVTNTFYLDVILRTAVSSLVILGLCLIVGYGTAYMIVQIPPRLRLWFLLLLTFPLLVSNVIRAYGWIAILGRQGLVNSVLREVGLIEQPLALLYSFQSAVFGLMTIQLPFMIIPIVNTLVAMDRQYKDAANSLGAGPVRTFFYVTLPLSSPGMAAGMLLVFLLTLSAYVTVTVLGGPRSKFLVSLVYDSVVIFQWPRAAALSFVLLAFALIGAAIIMAVLRPNRVQGQG